MLKKVLALALAGAMVLGSMSAFAAPGDMREDYDPTIKVTGLAKDDEANFYQIIEWVGITDENKDKPEVVGGWKAVEAYKDVLTPDVLKAILIDDPETDAKNDPRGITSELAGQLAQKASTPAKTVTVGESGEASYTIPEGKQGTYMVIITPKDIETIYNPVFVSSDYFENNTSEHGVPESSYADKAAAKKSKITTTKTFKNDQDYNGDNGDTTAVGDIITFTVETQIPQYGKVYTSPVFNVHDELTDLELVSIDSVKIKDGAELKDDATAVSITGGAGDDEYTIVFKSAWIKERPAATPIVITYKAKVTSSAQKNVNEEDNQVEVIYSHNPSDTEGNDFKAEKDTTQHYTFTIDAKGLGLTAEQEGGETGELIKVGLDGNGKVVTASSWKSWISPSQVVESTLAGAVFALYKTPEDAKADTKRYTNPEFTGTVTTDGKGKMEIKGLDAGTYYLKEISAPAGFIKDPSVHTIEITADFEDPVKITEYYTPNAAGTDVTWSATETQGSKPFTYETKVLKSYSVTIDGKNTSTHEFTNVNTSTKVTWVKESAKELPSSIVNTQGIELPSTGGIGTTLFYAGGAVLVLLAGVLLVSKRRIA